MKGKRNSGRSTKQMLEAPQNAFYVSSHVNAARVHAQLSTLLGRSDLQHRTLMWVQFRRYLGSKEFIIVDHAVELTNRHYEYLQAHNHRVSLIKEEQAALSR